MLEEHKFPLESFIAGWYINPNICSALIDLFHKTPKNNSYINIYKIKKPLTFVKGFFYCDVVCL